MCPIPQDCAVQHPAAPIRRGLRRIAWLSLVLAFPVVRAAAQPPDPTVLSARDGPITAIPVPPALDARKVALGERLFQDTRLSGDQTRACASCHDTRSNGATTKRWDRTPDGQALPLNTSTVFNAALSFRLNWTGSFRSLEAQAEASLRNPAIMGADMPTVLVRLTADPAIAGSCRAIHGRDLDQYCVVDALATYERSLSTPGSRFDRWLMGEDAALSTEELDGCRLFRSIGCSSCHQGVNIGGNMFQRHGIFHPLASPEPAVLRVPSLRNVATTPPYFHDGSAATLEDAVRGMSFAQLNRTLSGEEVRRIVAFLHTLTGTYQGRPVSPPP
jgi:cytochrome c peroxidase